MIAYGTMLLRPDLAGVILNPLKIRAWIIVFQNSNFKF